MLVVGHDGQNIQANAFRKSRFIQESIALHLRQRFGNALDGNRFQLELHRMEISYVFELLKMRNNFDNGSKKRSTTRSLSGIIALSVIVMPSGHTLVQHLVMLHSPMPNSFLSSSTRSPTSKGCISRAAA